MIIRLILLSFFVSIINLLVAISIPIDIPLSDSEKVVSPYREELDEMKGRGLNEEENRRHLELVAKNNQFFDDYLESLPKSTSAKDISDAWDKKFILLFPLHVLIWGVASYFFLRREFRHFYLFLTAPLAFTLIGLIPFTGLMMITVSVMSVWFWSILKHGSSGTASVEK